MTGGRLRRVLDYVGDEDVLHHLRRRRGRRRHHGADRLPPRAGHGRDRDRRAAARPLRRAGDRRRARAPASPRSRTATAAGSTAASSCSRPRCGATSATTTTIWEHEPLERLARDGQLTAYRHDGFWQPMDTLREHAAARGAVGVRRGAVAVMDVDPAFWRGRRVLVTGHTGFKGSWLALWLARLGAEVTGLSAASRPTPSLFELARVGERRATTCAATSATPRRSRARSPRRAPEVVLHLAAQPLVRALLRRPARDLRDQRDGHGQRARGRARAPAACARSSSSPRDKCYENREWEWAYREDEPMGGHDPYSSSQGRAELVTSAYRRSFFATCGRVGVGARRQRDRRRRLGRGPAGPRHHARRARRRAGRDPQPGRDRPWQHVLNPLSGYLLLAQALWDDPSVRRRLELRARRRTTRGRSAGSSSGSPSCGRASLRWEHDAGEHPHEAHYLKLDSSPRARAARLGAALGPRRGARRDRRVVRGAARRRGHARRHAGAARGASRSRSTAPMTPTCRFCARAAEADVRRPRHVAAGELLPAARAARTRWSRSIRCTRYVCAQLLPGAARRVRVAGAHLLATTPTSRRTRRRWLEHARALRRGDDRALRARRLDSQVVEIATNDGYLLQYFVERGIPVLGVEPAANVAEVARASRASRRSSSSSASRPRASWPRERQRRPAARQQRARPRARPQRLRRRHEDRCSSPDGVDHDRVPAPAAADRREPVRHDLPRALLLLLVHDRRGACSPPTACGCSTSRSCRRTAARCASSAATPTTRPSRDTERAARAAGARATPPATRRPRDLPSTSASAWSSDKRALLEFLIEAQATQGKRIVGYGAPAKGNTLLNYCGIGTDFLDYTVDRNPHKQGHFLPGHAHPDPRAGARSREDAARRRARSCPGTSRTRSSSSSRSSASGAGRSWCRTPELTLLP